MKLYRLRAEAYMVSGVHTWRLPAARCKNACKCPGGWGEKALSYPQIEIPATLPRSEYRLRSPLPWNEYEQLRDLLRRSVRPDLPLPPGTDFGPLVGTISGPPTDFAWIWDWDCFIRHDVLERLNERLSAPVRTAMAQILSKRKERPKYVEIVALPTASVTTAVEESLPPFSCLVCGSQFVSEGYFAYRETQKVPPVVKRSCIPNDTCIFRLRQQSRWVLCTEEFRETVLELALNNITFQPVLVDEE